MKYLILYEYNDLTSRTRTIREFGVVDGEVLVLSDVFGMRIYSHKFDLEYELINKIISFTITIIIVHKPFISLPLLFFYFFLVIQTADLS